MFFFRRPISNISCLSLSPDGTRALTGGRSGLLKEWDLARGNVVRDFSSHDADILSVAAHWESGRLVSTDRRGEVRVWQIGDGQLIQSYGKDEQPFLVRFGERASIQLNLAYLRRLELATNGGESLWSRPVDGLMEAALSESAGLVVCGQHKSMRFYSLQEGESLEVESLRSREFESYLCALSFSPDGKRVAVGSSQVDLFNTSDMGFDSLLPEAEMPLVSSFGWSADSRFLAASNLQGFIRIWDVEQKRCLSDRKFDHSIEQLAVNQDLTRVLFTGETDFAVWDRNSDSILRFPG